jgi:hypothetical protein
METQKYNSVDYAECAKREVKQRLRVYPRLVDAGKMSQARADKELELMQGIADYFESMTQGRLL